MIVSNEATILNNDASSARILIRLNLQFSSLCHSTSALRRRLIFIINLFRLRGSRAPGGKLIKTSGSKALQKMDDFHPRYKDTNYI